MNEAERLAYLDAMGVESYMPRVMLPGALPSVLCEMAIQDLLPNTLVNETDSSKDSLKKLQGSLVESKPARTVAASPSTTTTTSASAPIQTATQISVRFHWAIFQPIPEILLLIPVAHTDQNCMQLLKKILAAIDIVNVSLSALENFVWPPLSNHPAPSVVVGNSLSDARETLQALLEGYQLKQKQQKLLIKNVLVFDGNLGKTLFEGVSFPDMQLRILPSLQLMLTSTPEKIAEAKQLTWQRLKDLKN